MRLAPDARVPERRPKLHTSSRKGGVEERKTSSAHATIALPPRFSLASELRERLTAAHPSPCAADIQRRVYDAGFDVLAARHISKGLCDDG